MKVDVIILAAGQGSRMQLGYNKMYYLIDDISIIEKSVLSFYNNEKINNIIITYNDGELDTLKKLTNKYNPIYVQGGSERYKSVCNALDHVKSEYVLIHDGARCFISDALINKIANATIEYEAACLGVKSKDTIHLCDDKNNIIETTKRSNTFIAQTPQGFKTNYIKDVYQEVINKQDTSITDDVMAYNKYGNTNIKMIESDYSNIKVTTKDDL